MGNTYVETGKVCDVGENQLNLGGSIIGGCEVGTFVPKSNNDRSDISNISSSDFGVSVEQTSAIITNCDYYNINSGRFYGVDVIQTSATFTNCDFYNISGGSDGVYVAQTSATIISCEFHNISGGSFGVGVAQTSAMITNCNFCNISGGFWGVYVTQTSATIENCTFSAIESNSSTRYTPYSTLTSILSPKTGCKFLPEGKAQSIKFEDNCIINGEKVSDLLNS